MRHPCLLHLRAPKALLASVTAAHVAAALALFIVFDPASELQIADRQVPALAVMGVLFLMIALSLLQALRAALAQQGMIWMLCEDGRLRVRRQGCERLFRLEGEAIDFGWALWLCARAEPDEASDRPRCHWMVVPASLEPQGSWRALRIWLRHRAFSPPRP